METLEDLLRILPSLDPRMTIVASPRRPLSAGSPARLAPEGEGRHEAGSDLTYLLEVWLAREVAEVWAEWRNGRTPTTDELIEAVTYYADNDAYLPVEAP